MSTAVDYCLCQTVLMLTFPGAVSDDVGCHAVQIDCLATVADMADVAAVDAFAYCCGRPVANTACLGAVVYLEYCPHNHNCSDVAAVSLSFRNDRYERVDAVWMTILVAVMCLANNPMMNMALNSLMSSVPLMSNVWAAKLAAVEYSTNLQIPNTAMPWSSSLLLSFVV